MHFDDDQPDDSWFDWDPGSDDYDDPEFENEGYSLSDDLRDAERQIRIEKLRAEIERRGGSWETLTEGKDLTPESEEALLSQVLYFETAPRTTYAKMLIADGIELPAPELLSDQQAYAKLWEVIHGLAYHRVFLHYTDHLGDRELYARLWQDYLSHDTVDISNQPDAAYHLDMVGSGSMTDTQLWLQYYADEDERNWWLDSATNGELPESTPPPYDRDRLLPKRDEY